MDAELKAWYDKIYQYCYFHVRDRVCAEDLTQEAFLRYIRRWGAEETAEDAGDGKQLAYLYVIARNLCVDHFRRRGREEPRPQEELEERAGCGPERADMERLADTVALRDAVDSLPGALREIVALRFVLDEPALAVAALLGISRFAVYRRERKALKLLRECLEGERGGRT